MGWLRDRDHTEDGLQAVLVAAILGIVSSALGLLAFLETGTPMGPSSTGMAPGSAFAVWGGFAGQLIGLFLFAAWVSFVLEAGEHGDAHKRNVILASVTLFIGMFAFLLALIPLFPSSADAVLQETTVPTVSVMPSLLLAVGLTPVTAVAIVFFLHRLVAPDRRRWLYGFILVTVAGVGAAAAGVLALPATLETGSDLLVMGPYLAAAEVAALVGYGLLLAAVWPTYRGWDGSPPGAPGPEGRSSVDLPCPICDHRVQVRPDRLQTEKVTCPECGFQGRLPESMRA